MNTKQMHSPPPPHPPASLQTLLPLTITSSIASSSPFRTQLTYNTHSVDRYLKTSTSVENKENNPTKVSRRSMMMCLPDCSALWKEIEQRNVERDEMMSNIQLLTEKNQNVKEALKREESVKQHQITIMKKTHETQLEIKNSLIRNLEDIIDEQEARIFNLESHLAGVTSLSPKALKQLGGVKRLQELVDNLTNKVVEATESFMNEQELRKNLEIQLTQREQYIKSCQTNGFAHKFYESATDSEKQLKKVEKERTELKEHVKLLQSQLEQAGRSNQAVQLEYDRLDLQLMEKTMAFERQEMELRCKSTDEQLRLQSENDSLKNEITKLKQMDNEIKAIAEANDNLLETAQERLQIERNERAKGEIFLKEMKEICNKQEVEIIKWKSAVIELEKQLEDQSFVAEKELEQKCAEIDQLKQGINRYRRDTSNWQQRHADTIISLDCFRASLKSLREEQAELLQAASCIPSNIQHILVNVRQQISRHLSICMSDLVTKYKHEMRLRKEYHNQLIEIRGNIRVFCRVRPVISHDNDNNSVIEFDPYDDTLLYVKNEARTQTFTLDKVFAPQKSQEDIFAEVRPLLTSCVDGYNVCIFAYGQTGSGKTYTMEGPLEDPGINQRALSELFEETETRKPDWSFSITVSMLEIYNEHVRDLLANDVNSSTNLNIKMTPEGNLGVPGLTFVEVCDVKEVNRIFQIGRKARVTAATNLNDVSSRSHAILNVNVVGTNEATSTKTFGRLHLVDLAGSERVSKSAASGDRLKEAQAINKSLSALGDVIWALKNKHQHVPFRNSKLTYLLQDSLAGDSKTVMMVQVAPVADNVGESVCSLNFAKRVRTVELGQASAAVKTSLLSVLPNGQDSYDDSPANMVRCSPRLKSKLKR